MKIALIGYGKMGKAIEAIAVEQHHEIVLKIDVNNAAEFTAEKLALADVAIEFTGPHSAVENIMKCLSFSIPVVSGSTGWLENWDKVANYCREQNGTLIYSSNYSIGVNLFFEVNKFLAGLMEQYPSYDVMLKEIHHTQKKDAPSGTAITLAEQVLQNLSRKTSWTNEPVASNSNLLEIQSERIDPAPGTHHVKYTSSIDDIEIIHTAHNRTGFAGGAVTAAQFAVGKKGIYTMKEVLGLA
ncbi:dihydrodipicolinate reductase C-terminal domain-containing protein [Sediminibacterium sp.]|uniref:4-hydroxy-tetrahydrodipicolinate reductase n=1 Tax=Sediminibacterium sp. TaxID=1917865 RepID=UPI0025EB342A|nr:dihydrodipicolinate reductase C-terminal domain-containing protein [Sediminibacterium sp.]MBT9483385.1 4-hydroxy-tetrahydrodipicolinate reductase [Sediminibacterium sp.]